MQPVSPLHVHVRTKSGQQLGQVVDLTIDPDTQGVIAYHIKPSRLLPDVVRTSLVVHQSQIISITDREMIVDDGVMRDRRPTTAPLPSA